MSRPCSNNLVAVIVLQRIVAIQMIAPAIEPPRSMPNELRARKIKGSKAYPRTLIVVYSST
jgi:hypothetical protein